MTRLAILGASGHGKVIADIAETCGWTDVVFFDDAWSHKKFDFHWKVEGNSEALIARLSEFQGVAVAIGDNARRYEKLTELSLQGAKLTTLIHPSAVLSRYSSIGEGSVVCAGAVLGVDTVIGMGAIINTSCSLDHDCSLGDAVHISPGAHLAGSVRVEGCSWIGIGVSVRQLIHIGKRVMVGAGAVVINDIPDDTIVAGVPAKPLPDKSVRFSN